MEPTRLPVTTDATHPTGQTNAYVLGPEPALLVDPGSREPSVTAQLERESVEHVAVTHHHPDHVGAVADYAREFDLTVWARAGRERAFEDAAGIEPDQSIAPGETIPAGAEILALDTPGHAPEHLAFGGNSWLVSGDLAVETGSVVVGAPEGDMRAYLSSLRRVHALGPDRLYPGHGPVIEDPRTTCERLIRHRLDREQAVNAAVERGIGSPEALVDAVYEKDVSAVRDLARATVVAHLEKLAVEGAIEWDGSRAQPV